MSDVEDPQFSLPFTFDGNGSAFEVEIGSDQEIQQAVWAILSYLKGQFWIDPNFGIDDPTFVTGGVNLTVLAAQILEYEPRAQELFDSDDTWLQTAVQTIIVERDTSVS